MPRTIVRTPRKEKSFFRFTDSKTVDHNDSGGIFTSDILDQYKSDLGLNESRNLTVMNLRIRCEINRDDQTNFTQIVNFHNGIAWVPKTVTTSTQFPNPAANGIRDTRWIHKWDQQVLNDSVAQDRPGDNRFGDPIYKGESRNMAKQPSAGHNLTWIMTPSFIASDPTQISNVIIIIEGMLALP